MAELATTHSDAPLVGEATTLTTVPLSQNPVVRQLGVMVGIAASVALGVAVILWSQTPNYSILAGNLGQKDAMEILDVLRQSNIEFKVDETSGAVMVPSARLNDAKMKLAGMGLPRSDGLGFELLQQERGFGTSRLVEAARYQKAIEGELARTISTLGSIQSARVHLAMPKRSVFIQPRKVVSASVAVKLYSGRALERGQVESIVHLVASSVPELEAGNVTVVDQKGQLLSGRQDDRNMMMNTRQFEYTRQLEEHFKQRVEDILSPMVGVDKVRAEVTAEVDFTVMEQTEERFNPDSQAIRSEQLSERANNAGGPEGVPGALTNQPPAAGNAPEQAGGADGGAGAGAAQSSSKNTTRNYEVDKTVSHTRNSIGRLRKLSVAVVVDDRVQPGPEAGKLIRVERTPEELERITQLVREAVGFNLQRGDSVKVINSAFLLPPEPEPLPELPIWQQPWALDLAKQVAGLLLVLILIFGVLKPTINKLTHPVVVKGEAEGEEGAEGGAEGAEGEAEGEGKLLPRKEGEPLLLTGSESYVEVLDAARDLIHEDPKRVAQLMKAWVAEDANG
jgi:flagellar M-ring protein FliF